MTRARGNVAEFNWKLFSSGRRHQNQDDIDDWLDAEKAKSTSFGVLELTGRKQHSREQCTAIRLRGLIKKKSTNISIHELYF